MEFWVFNLVLGIRVGERFRKLTKFINNVHNINNIKNTTKCGGERLILLLFVEFQETYIFMKYDGIKLCDYIIIVNNN